MKQMIMPNATGGGRMRKVEGNVMRRVQGIDELIPENYSLERRMFKGTTLPEIRKRLRGQVIIQDKEQALEEARKEREGLVLWTDESRKEDEWTGCAVVWKEGRWNKRRVHFGRQKEALDAEMYVMSEAVKIADEISRNKEVRRVTIFMDSQATLRRIHRQKCKSTIDCATRTRAHAQLIASFPWTPARRAAYSRL
jgi:hypothetical protein